MKFFNVKDQDQVTHILKDLGKDYQLERESVGINEAIGRVAASPVCATADVPAFNRSTVDGYAVISTDSHGATESIPALVDLKGIIEMGTEVTASIGTSETMYVPTGGMLPKAADGVVMIEDTEKLDDLTIGLMKSIAQGANVIYRGDDIKEGATILEVNKKISALDIGALSAQGIASVEVWCRPKVTVISTGDEIIPVEATIELGQIYDINGYVLEQLLVESGGSLVKHRIVKDDYECLFEAVSTAADVSDVVLLSGGSSVGTRDYTYDVIKNLPDSQMFVQGIAIKPGKPTIIGRGKGKLIVGLPGHPVSSIMVYKAFVDYYMRQLLGQPNLQADFVGSLTENVHSAPGKTTYQMISIEGDAFDLNLTPVHGKSGMISLLTRAQGYIVIESHQEGLNKGTKVAGYRL